MHYITNTSREDREYRMPTRDCSATVGQREWAAPFFLFMKENLNEEQAIRESILKQLKEEDARARARAPKGNRYQIMINVKSDGKEESDSSGRGSK